MKNHTEDSSGKVLHESAQVTGSGWEFTPAVKWVIARAAKIAAGESDPMIRTGHIEAALREAENRVRCPNCCGTGWVRKEEKSPQNDKGRP